MKKFIIGAMFFGLLAGLNGCSSDSKPETGNTKTVDEKYIGYYKFKAGPYVLYLVVREKEIIFNDNWLADGTNIIPEWPAYPAWTEGRSLFYQRPEVIGEDIYGDFSEDWETTQTIRQRISNPYTLSKIPKEQYP